MARLGHLALLSVVGIVSAFEGQQPLLDKEADCKPYCRSLVDTEQLQSKIIGKNLLARAEDLYKLAELSWHEYNRPTRVIGKLSTIFIQLRHGCTTFQPVHHSLSQEVKLLLTSTDFHQEALAMQLLWITSGQLSQNLVTTTMSRSRHSQLSQDMCRKVS